MPEQHFRIDLMDLDGHGDRQRRRMRGAARLRMAAGSNNPDCATVRRRSSISRRISTPSSRLLEYSTVMCGVAALRRRASIGRARSAPGRLLPMRP
jgi:hypothetical protein